jgi:transposase InsO family protein
LVATEYVTKWAKVLATKTDDAKTVAKFLYENIITRFGCPKELVSDWGTHFLNSTIEQLTTKYLIKHRKSTPYHPRTNGQTEKTNGILCKIITKTVQGSNTDWDARLFDALWAYRCAYKVTTKHTPFQLVCGQEAILPIEIELPSLRVALEERLRDEESLTHRYEMLEKLEETRAQAYLNMVVAQKHQKTYYYSKLEPKVLKENDLILLYDSRFSKFPGKFKMCWFGPY